jgi:probable rRNA maturation factor
MSSEPGHPGAILFRSAPRGLDRKRVRAAAKAVVHAAAPGRSFCVLVTSDDELRRLNRDFRGKDQPTDVLSFPAPDPSGYLGDLAISVHRAAQQARDFGHDTETEIAILMLHGLLHLLGHDHESDRGRMRKLEANLRFQLGLPTGLIERASR